MRINKFTPHIIYNTLGISLDKKKKRIEQFYGSWNKKDYQNFLKTSHLFQKIDKELWQ